MFVYSFVFESVRGDISPHVPRRETLLHADQGVTHHTTVNQVLDAGKIVDVSPTLLTPPPPGVVLTLTVRLRTVMGVVKVVPLSHP